MRTIHIKCPHCQKFFDHIVNVEGRVIKTFCPYCENPITVGIQPKPIRLDLGGNAAPAAKPQAESPRPQAESPKPKMAQATMAQQIHESLNAKQQTDDTITHEDMLKSMGQPMLMFGNHSFKLALGMNMVGRKSETSQATLQLPTDDRYMSRVNARIDVSRTVSGSWHVTISSVNERNLVKVNGRTVSMTDKLVLMNGQVITLGHSDVYFCLK